MAGIENKAGANNIWNFEFKENGKFRLIEDSRLGEIIFRGTYIKSNDTIEILHSNYNDLSKFPKTGIIRNDTTLHSLQQVCMNAQRNRLGHKILSLA